jgi:hypothetical protein
MAAPTSAEVRAIAKKIREEADLLYKTRPLLRVAKAKGGVQVWEDYGNKLQIPVTTGEHSNITQFTGVGDQSYDLNTNEIGALAEYDWADAGIPVVYTDREDRLNGGSETRRVETKLQRIEMTRAKFERDFEQQITKGDVTALSSWNTLNGGLGTGNGVANGFLYTGATGTDGGTVGGLARSAAALLVNQAVADNSDIENAIRLADNNARLVSSGGTGVDLILMTAATLTELEKQGFTQTRYVDPASVEMNSYVYMFRGAEVAATSYLPTGITAYGISFADIKLCMHANANFTFRAFERLPGTQKHAAYIDISGQLVSHGRLGESFSIENAASLTT